MEEYFISNGKSVVDTCINLTGFALVGGPASQDHAKAVSTLEKLNVPYLCTVPLVFQSFEEWQASELGLHPIQVALQVSTKLLCMHTRPFLIFRFSSFSCLRGGVQYNGAHVKTWCLFYGRRRMMPTG